MKQIDEEQISRAALRMEQAADRASAAAERMEAAAHRIALLLEDGYGGNGLRLIDYRHFAAMQFYRMDCHRSQTIPIRWGTLREDLREKYLAQADAQVREWAEDEEDARKRREE